MRSKIKSAKGFTLAELLIVVAIIGVLVAIAIPIFTGQLERSREAVDLSDVRSAYAEVMMAAITGDTTAKYTKDDKQTIWNNGNYSITVAPLRQQKDGWQTPLPITIGGVSSGAGEPQWVGNPGPKGSCVITYHPAEGTNSEYVSFVWSGGTSGDNGNSGTDNDGDNSKPEITPGSGTNGEKNFETIITDSQYGDWPERPANDNSSTVRLAVIDGQVVRYNGAYYFYHGRETVNRTFNYYDYFSPTNDIGKGRFQELTGMVHYENEGTEEGVSEPSLKTLRAGDLYQSDDGKIYVYHAGSEVNAVPPSSSTKGNWTQLIIGSLKDW